MILILLGPPGAGKGTISAKLKKDFKVPAISTGDMLRAAIKNKSMLGEKVQEYLDNGQLVPDDLIVDIVAERISEEDCQKGFILDGFPRTIVQARLFNQLCQKIDKSIDHVLYFKLQDQAIIKRLTARRVCTKCGIITSTLYDHFEVDKKKCTECGGQLIQRNDDQEDTIKERLKVYKKETKPLVNFYEEKGKLVTIDADQKISEVYNEVCNKIPLSS